MMILRNLVIATTCALALTCAAHGQAQRDDQKSDNQQQQSQSEQTKPASTQSPIISPTLKTQAANQGSTETKIYQPDCGRPKDQPDADLCTQRRVADAAEKALQYSLAQTIIGALGVAFVVVTLGFTAQANKAAAIAAQAAIDAVGAERAWMSFAGFDMMSAANLIVDGVSHKEGFVFQIRWINQGRSPAIDVDIRRTFAIVRGDRAFPDMNSDGISEGKTGVLGPSQLANSNQFAIVGEDFEDFRSRRCKVAVISQVNYKTTVNETVNRYTGVSGYIEFNGYADDNHGTRIPRASIMMDGKHNIAS